MHTTVLSQADFYKTGHYKMYPENTTKISSNLTARKSRMNGVREVVVFGIQYFVLEYLIKQWNENFFVVSQRNAKDPELVAIYKGNVIKRYKRLMDNTLGVGAVDMAHIEQLWDLGYIPLEIKALPEGE